MSCKCTECWVDFLLLFVYKGPVSCRLLKGCSQTEIMHMCRKHMHKVNNFQLWFLSWFSRLNTKATCLKIGQMQCSEGNLSIVRIRMCMEYGKITYWIDTVNNNYERKQSFSFKVHQHLYVFQTFKLTIWVQI